MWFWCLNHQTVSAGFEALTGKLVPIIFRPNHRETIDLGFEVKPRNMHSLSPYAWCKPHKVSPDLAIIRPPSIRPVIDHPRSSTQDLLLLPRYSSMSTMSHMSPAHHETSKRDSPHKIDWGRTTETSQIRIQTEASQLLITIKPRYWPLGFSISPLMSTLTTKSTKFKF
jgi:hypothetical protein